MPDWSNIEWSVLLAHAESDAGPWYALGVAAGVVFIGFIEMRTSKTRKTGLSTWGFAVPPFLAAIFWVATWTAIPFLVRLLFLVALILGTWKGLWLLYRYAERFESNESQGQVHANGNGR